MDQIILISLTLFIIGFIIGRLSNKFKSKVRIDKLNKPKVTIIKELLDYNNRTLTVVDVYSDGSSKTSKYAGDCTIWHELPAFRACTTHENNILYDKQKAYEYLTYRRGNTLDGYELLNNDL